MIKTRKSLPIIYLFPLLMAITACANINENSNAANNQTLEVVSNSSVDYSNEQNELTIEEFPSAGDSDITKSPLQSSELIPIAKLPNSTNLDPQDWMNWPVIPIITSNVLEIYELGQSLGRSSNSFSIFGDCQSTPEAFLGLFRIDNLAYDSLPTHLQNTVDFFGKSFSRESPTAKPGTTTGALLWTEWHESKNGCQSSETPVDCELRLNNPSYVLLAVGTHYETRNEYYLRIIIEELLSQGIIPILSTKADNREEDHSINLATAKLAIEYNIPLWNFWALSKDLPSNGLFVKEGEEHLGAIYFTAILKDRHRVSALETLTEIWQAIESNN